MLGEFVNRLLLRKRASDRMFSGYALSQGIIVGRVRFFRGAGGAVNRLYRCLILESPMDKVMMER